MTTRHWVVFLGILLLVLILVIFNMPSANNGGESAEAKGKDSREENTKADKVSGGAQEARFKATIKKFVKSIGDIEARLQVVETNMKRFGKEEKRSHKEIKEHKEVKEHKEGKEHKEHEEVKEHKDNQEHFQGEIKQGNKCLDSLERGEGGEVEVIECHQLGRNQYFVFMDGTITHKGLCLSLGKVKQGAKVVMERCHAKNFMQNWTYHDGLFQARESAFCMENKADKYVILEQCDEEKKSQKWTYS